MSLSFGVSGRLSVGARSWSHSFYSWLEMKVQLLAAHFQSSSSISRISKVPVRKPGENMEDKT